MSEKTIKFSMGEKVVYTDGNKRKLEDNYIVGFAIKEHGVVYQLEDQDGIKFLASEENISRSNSGGENNDLF